MNHWTKLFSPFPPTSLNTQRQLLVIHYIEKKLVCFVWVVWDFGRVGGLLARHPVVKLHKGARLKGTAVVPKFLHKIQRSSLTLHIRCFKRQLVAWLPGFEWGRQAAPNSFSVFCFLKRIRAALDNLTYYSGICRTHVWGFSVCVKSVCLSLCEHFSVSVTSGAPRCN